MKFANMRVEVPIDDAMPVGLVHEHLRKLLEERGTESVNIPLKPNGEAEAKLVDAPAAGRIHWTAVEVVQAIERAPRTAGRKTTGKGQRA
jgi:hypothetical protein